MNDDYKILPDQVTKTVFFSSYQSQIILVADQIITKKTLKSLFPLSFLLKRRLASAVSKLEWSVSNVPIQGFLNHSGCQLHWENDYISN